MESVRDTVEWAGQPDEGASTRPRAVRPDIEFALREAAHEIRRPVSLADNRISIPLDEYTALTVGLSPRQLRAKRIFDVVLSTTLLFVSVALMLIIACGILVTSGRPVIFRQKRVGRGGRQFTLLKFRTMHANAEKRLEADTRLRAIYLANDFKVPAEKDPRVTWIGKFLRRTSIDELPQFWNVLRGDMSIVGPRPVVPDELAQYSDLAPLYCSMRPGLTGEWQVFGRYRMTFPERGLKELEYLCKWSLWRDTKTVLKTVPAALRSNP